MAAAATDLLQEVGIATATTLDAPGYTISDTSITVVSTTNWPTATGITFAMDELDANGDQVAGSYNEYVGVVSSATSITSVSHQNGTDQNYSAGTTTRVYIPVSAERENRIVEWGLVHANQDGTIKDGVVESETLKQTIACKVELSAGQAIPTGTVSYTVLQLDNEVFDYGSDFNTSTYRFVAPKSGLYFAKAQVLFENLGVDNICGVQLVVDGTDVQYETKGNTSTAADDAHVICTGFVEMTAGQYLDVRVAHDKGSDTNLNSAEKYCHLIVSYMGSV